jgi:hypothetical protein
VTSVFGRQFGRRSGRFGRFDFEDFGRKVRFGLGRFLGFSRNHQAQSHRSLHGF